MTTPDVNVFLIDFQVPGKEMVVSNEDGSYTILINARLSQDERLNAYWHALGHINGEDFEKPDIQSIELQAHGLKPCKEPVHVPVDEYEQRIRHLQRKRKKIQKALKEREKEIRLIADLYGPDCFFRVAEQRWLYGESD